MANRRLKICPICRKRPRARGDSICQTCRSFIREYVETGRLRHQRAPLNDDVLEVMRLLDINQDRAVELLGGPYQGG